MPPKRGPLPESPLSLIAVKRLGLAAQSKIPFVLLDLDMAYIVRLKKPSRGPLGRP